MKTLQLILAVALASVSTSFAEGRQFKITTYHLELPTKELPEVMRLNETMTFGQTQVSMRGLSQLNGAKLTAFPSITLNPDKQEAISVVTQHSVERFGTTKIEEPGHKLTYLLTTVDGTITIQGVFNYRKVNTEAKPKVISIQNEEIIFDRVCQPDMTIRVTVDNTHLLITPTQIKEE